MTLTFQAVTLDTETPDGEATLVFRDGRLLAVLSRLSDIHDDLAGRWFIEAAFGEVPRPHQTFETLDTLEAWFAGPA